eukprot:1159983-Pelagomonas_calceolata.AAC.2
MAKNDVKSPLPYCDYAASVMEGAMVQSTHRSAASSEKKAPLITREWESIPSARCCCYSYAPLCRAEVDQITWVDLQQDVSANCPVTGPHEPTIPPVLSIGVELLDMLIGLDKGGPDLQTFYSDTLTRYKDEAARLDTSQLVDTWVNKGA